MQKILLALLCAACSHALSAQLVSSNLPIVVINTNGQTIVDEPKIMADMGIVYNPGARNFLAGPFNHYNGKIGIEIRGQSSQSFPMKSYSLELWNSAGASVDQSLFGLPKESDWVLYAPYTDKTLMRNFLAYTFSREMGHWAANCRYVELVVNGDYKGVYVFMEKIKRNAGRVNIPKINTPDITGDALTGGYIFSIDKEADGWHSAYSTPNSTRNQRIQFSYVYPKITAIAPQQANYVKLYVDSFENALAAVNFKDPANGWRRLADEPSFIDYFIVNEASRNVDGYRLSTYLYKDRQSKGGKIVAGPVWDYDLAFRNANYCQGSQVEGWAADFNRVCPQDYWQIPFWWNRLFEDEQFRANLRCRWKALRQTSLSNQRVNDLVDSIYALVGEAQARHFTRWPVLGQYIWPNPQPIAGTYSDEITYLKTWLQARLAWIDGNLPNEGACYDYPAGIKESVQITGMPNPVRSQYTIELRSRMAQPITVQAWNMNGQSVYKTAQSVQPGMNRFSIDMQNWQTGIYLLRLTAGSGETHTVKLLRD